LNGRIPECEPNGGIKASDNAAFGAQPQGYAKLDRWAETALYRRLGLERDDLVRESSSRSIFLFEHDLFGKLVPTFPDHALADRETLLLWRHRGR
jgi:hypothetical protein